MYNATWTFYCDVLLMFENIRFLNSPHSTKYQQAVELQHFFEDLWKKTDVKEDEGSILPEVVIVQDLRRKPGRPPKKNTTPSATPPPVARHLRIQTPDAEETTLSTPSGSVVSLHPSDRAQRHRNFAKRFSPPLFTLFLISSRTPPPLISCRVQTNRKVMLNQRLKKPKISAQALNSQLVPRLLRTNGRSLKCGGCAKDRVPCIFLSDAGHVKCQVCTSRMIDCNSATAVRKLIAAQATAWKGPWLVPHPSSGTPLRRPVAVLEEQKERTRPLSKWSVVNVCEWLAEHQLERLRPHFQARGIDGAKLANLRLSQIAWVEKDLRSPLMEALLSLHAALGPPSYAMEE